MNRQAWGAAVFFLTAIVLAFACSAAIGYARGVRSRDLRAGPSVQGLVLTVDERRHWLNRPDYMVQYKYEVNAVVYTGTVVLRPKKLGDLGYGTPVEVHYLRGQPKVSRIEGDDLTSSGDTRFFVSLALLVLFAIPDVYLIRALWATRPRW